uniref:Uncharacterized protein n=1 Tax=Picea sitchensis TaxID=3332 RepID=A9NSR7_PICSI|nr:unknown [Picea sitchensis]
MCNVCYSSKLALSRPIGLITFARWEDGNEGPSTHLSCRSPGLGLDSETSSLICISNLAEFSNFFGTETIRQNKIDFKSSCLLQTALLPSLPGIRAHFWQLFLVFLLTACEPLYVIIHTGMRADRNHFFTCLRFDGKMNRCFCKNFIYF